MLIRLGVEDNRDALFDCGNADLNEFFFKDSKLADIELVAVTYIWREGERTEAFFSVSNDAVTRTVHRKGFNRAARGVAWEKRLTTLPAVKIGRLAVNAGCQKNGLGSGVSRRYQRLSLKRCGLS